MTETVPADHATHWWRRLRPRRVRTRLTLLYTSLFLAGGVVLLGLTFGLVSNSLRSASTSALPQPSPALLNKCKNEVQTHTPSTTAVTGTVGTSGTGKPTPHPVKGHPSPLNAKCKEAFLAGAEQGTTSQRNHTMHELEVYSLLGLALLTVASAGLGWLMAGRALRPVHDITAAAQRASERHLGERLNLRGPEDELKELADTFDAMLNRLDLAFAAQRQFVANASHELRTPLTSMRTAIDVVLAKPARTPEQLEAMAEKVRRSIDRAERIIDALLTLAVSNQGLERTEPVDLSTAAEDALDGVAETARDADIAIEAELAPAKVEGSRVLLERMVGNLVENAVVHNVQGGWVRLRAGTDDGHAFFEVANSGPVVAPDQVSDLFEPFRRADERTGSGGVGLGLSIVRSVGNAHGAALDARAATEGGLVVTVTMPVRNGESG